MIINNKIFTSNKNNEDMEKYRDYEKLSLNNTGILFFIKKEKKNGI